MLLRTTEEPKVSLWLDLYRLTMASFLPEELKKLAILGSNYHRVLQDPLLILLLVIRSM